MKLSVLAAPVALVLAGCVTDLTDKPQPVPRVNYVPSAQPGKSLDDLRTEVEAILSDTRKWHIRRNFSDGSTSNEYMADSTSFSDDGVFMRFTVAGPAAYRYQFSYAELADLQFNPTTCTTTSAPLPQDMEISFNGATMGPEVCNALFALGQRIRQDGGKATAAFAEQAVRYRAMAVKPALSEDLRRLIVQAETLRERKDYTGASNLMRQALRHDPVAYPAGYFNLALLYEQQENYARAIDSMKKYLLLQPGAKDARSAQDKIYSWELLARQ